MTLTKTLTACSVCISALAIFALSSFAALGAPPPKQASYASPLEAVEALVSAARSGNTRDMLTILGPAGAGVTSSGDAVADAAARDRFVSAFDEAHEIRQSGDRPFILYLGNDDFPFPIPLVSDNGKWRFDTAAGAEEILDRRIGANELSAIEVMRAYVDAQREYAEADRDGKGLQYARRLLSRINMRDGLYWPTAEGETESPLGPLVAEAHGQDYGEGRRGPVPYHGYFFRVLTAQGKDAKGGARDYIVNGRMIGGFALIASPAEYGNSGVKTFIVDQDGIVFEKDLGADTGRIASRIAAFDPDSGWSEVPSTK